MVAMFLACFEYVEEEEETQNGNAKRISEIFLVGWRLMRDINQVIPVNFGNEFKYNSNIRFN